MTPFLLETLDRLLVSGPISGPYLEAPEAMAHCPPKGKCGAQPLALLLPELPHSWKSQGFPFYLPFDR